ncbi:MAG: SH3 domain-containing protein [Anaerolineae bacterium]|nr:SH3 domain-containing protein [Anaerolineae bacterium]
MIARRRTIILYLVMGAILGSGLVPLLSFSLFEQQPAVPQAATGRPAQSFTPPANLLEGQPATGRDIPPASYRNHPQAAASPFEQPTSTLVFTTEVAGPIQAPVLTAHNPINVRSGPGVGYTLLTRLPAQQMASVVGRNDDGAWLAIPTVGGKAGSNGWVSAALVTVTGDTGTVPVISTLPLAPAPRYR